MMENGRASVTARNVFAAAMLPGGTRLCVRLLNAFLEKAGELFGAGMCEGVPSRVELELVTDAEMAALNERAMGTKGPTNVLSFPAAPIDGDACLALSPQTLLREAFLYGQDPTAHLVRLLAHGVGHVCGLDHGEEMYSFTDELEAVGNALVATAGRESGEGRGFREQASRDGKDPVRDVLRSGEASGEAAPMPGQARR